jgi:hypothetical protein
MKLAMPVFVLPGYAAVALTKQDEMDLVNRFAVQNFGTPDLVETLENVAAREHGGEIVAHYELKGERWVLWGTIAAPGAPDDDSPGYVLQTEYRDGWHRALRAGDQDCALAASEARSFRRRAQPFARGRWAGRRRYAPGMAGMTGSIRPMRRSIRSRRSSTRSRRASCDAKICSMPADDALISAMSRAIPSSRVSMLRR